MIDISAMVSYKRDVMLSLRPYQSDLISKARMLMKNGCRSLVIQSATGSGKTLLTAWMLKSCAERGQRAFFVVHRRELVKQSIRAFGEVGLPYGVISAGWWEEKNHPIQIASVQSLVRRHHRFRKPNLIIWDECFSAGTLVDGFPIEHIKTGDMVRSYNHEYARVDISRVVRTYKSKPNTLCRVKIGSLEFVCTTAHPFFVKGKGYVQAKNLSLGDMLLVQSTVRNNEELAIRKDEKIGPIVLREVLLDGLLLKALIRNYGKNKSSICFGSDDGTKSYAKGIGKVENDSHVEEDWTPALNSWGKWDWINTSADYFARFNNLCKSADGIYRSNGDTLGGIPHSLQNRHSVSIGQIGGRSGRQLSSRKTQRAGFEERGISEIARVDSVEILEPDSSGSFGSYLPNDFVYNLEVEGNNNYFVNGILVHNCHHLGAKSWAALHDQYPDAYHIGLTATPCRLDGRGLGTFFQEMIHGPSVAWLIENGFLSKYRLFAPPGVSTQGIHTQMGDYAKNELGALVDRPTITGDAIAHYKRLASGKRAIVFAVSIEHSKHVVSQFQAAGITAEHIDGETPMEVRDAAIKRFEEGKTLILSNVELCGEGFDLPAIEVGILLRPTMSIGLYLQQIGRTLRPYPGKETALVLDHVGNCQRHGLPDEERNWTLAGVSSRASQSATGVSVKVCGRCFAAQLPGVAACRFCGYVFDVQSREVEQVPGELEEIDPAVARTQRVREQGSAQDLNALIALGKARKYRNAYAWARYVWQGREQKRRQEQSRKLARRTS